MSSGKRVRIEDINYLMQKLNNYAYLWSELGTALDFHPGELDNIRYSPQAVTLQQRLKELLSRWSQWPTQDHRRVPTMEMLRDALRSRLVGLGAVATQVYESRHGLPSWQEKPELENLPLNERKPTYVPTSPPIPGLRLKIVGFIILTAVIIFVVANLIPIVVEYSLIFVYVLSISLAIILFLIGYAFLESFD